MVVRDQEDRSLAPRTWRNFKASTYIAEAYATMVAVTHSNDLGLQQIILEGDSLQMLMETKKETKNNNVVGLKISERWRYALVVDLYSLFHEMPTE